jgi:hypothetical protein
MESVDNVVDRALILRLYCNDNYSSFKKGDPIAVTVANLASDGNESFLTSRTQYVK